MRKSTSILMLAFFFLSFAFVGVHAQKTSLLKRSLSDSLDLRGKPVGFKIRSVGNNGKIVVDVKTSEFMRSPQKASGYVPIIYGTVIFDNTWTSDTKAPAVYSFPASADGFKMTKEISGDEFNAMCGYGVEDTYHVLSSKSYDTNLYDYNMEDWSQTGKTSVWSKAYIGMDLTYDPSTKQVYGAFPNSSYGADHLIFGSVDYTKNYNNVTEIGSFGDVVIVGIAANSQGEVYAISKGGDLYKVDKEKGTTTLVGNTGVDASDYIQSATFDPKTGDLYWACTLANETSALYKVDVKTATATKIFDFPNSQEIVALHIPAPKAEDGAPASATDLNASFLNGSLTGDVSFTVPSTTFAGDPLTGNVTYSVTVNDETAATGTVMAGEHVKVSITAKESGEKTIKVILNNEVGNSPVAKTSLWIGNDTPAQVKDLVLTISDKGEAKLLWSAVKDGIHNGYIDSKNITYRVTRYPDAKVVATTANTVFTENLPTDAQLANYYYTVEAVNGEMVGQPAESNVVAFGSAFNVPFSDDQSTQTYLPFYLVLDVNGDGTTWAMSKYYGLSYSYSSTNNADDWLLTPPIRLVKGNDYLLSFTYACGYSGTEKLAVGYGLGSDVKNYTEVMPVKEISGSDDQSLSFRVSPATDGDYRFGFHALSDANQYRISIKKIQVDVAPSLAVPDTVKNLNVKPAENGQLKATISMTAPTLTQDGKQLTEITKIELFRNDTILIKTFDALAAGSVITYDDEKPENGLNKYSAVAYNSEGKGAIASSSAWVGLDAPLAATDVKVIDNGDDVSLSWTTPTGNVGVNGGYVDESKIRFSIYDPTNGMAIVAQHIKGEDFHDTKVHTSLGEKQGSLYYIIYAETEVNDTTFIEGKGALSPYMRTGMPQSLPFAESMANGEPQADGCWSENNYYYSWGTTSSLSADNDGGALAFKSEVADDWSIWHTPKLTLEGNDSPYFSFSYYATPKSSTVLSVSVMGPDYQPIGIDTISMEKETVSGWKTVRYSLIPYKSQRFVIMGIKAYVPTIGDYAVVDNVRLRNVLENDLKAEISVPSEMYAGIKTNISVNVKNIGNNVADGYTVKLYKNDELFEQKTGTAVDIDGETKYDFAITPSVKDSKITFYAEVDYAADEDLTNNTTEKKTTEVKVNDLPGVDNVNLALNDGKVTFSWTPVSSEAAKPITDDFEAYTDWAESGFGDWITYDGDGAYSYSLGSDFPFPNAGYPFAFKVMNTSAWNMSDENKIYLGAHSGSKYLACFDAAYTDETQSVKNDDWLISPELSGAEQTIKFFAKSLHIDETAGLETFEICYSNGSVNSKDFTVLSTIENAAAEWTEYSQVLPAGAKRFAIHVISKKCHALFVDDVTYSGKSNEVTAYNVYRDGELVATKDASDNNYVENYDGNDNHEYQVSVVYTTGESALSKPISLSTSSVITTSISALKENTAVYTISGQYVGNSSECLNMLKPGVYISGGKKFVVR